MIIFGLKHFSFLNDFLYDSGNDAVNVFKKRRRYILIENGSSKEEER